MGAPSTTLAAIQLLLSHTAVAIVIVPSYQHHIYHGRSWRVSAGVKAHRVFPLKWDIHHLENKEGCSMAGGGASSADWTLEN